jgi:rod shape-determining protein MreC
MMTNRSHLIALGIVVLLSMVLLNLPSRAAAHLRTAIGSLFLPIFGFAGSAQQAAEAGVNLLVPRRTLIEQNERLRKENQQLRLEAQRSQETDRENARLRQALGWQQKAGTHYRLARVVGNDPVNWWRSAQIDLGSRDGLRADLPVVTTDGLVGRVSEVGFDRSQVLLIGDPNCRFSARVVETGDRTGIISPGSAAASRQTVILTLPNSDQLKLGQKVVTSGLGGVFPRDILVGWIMDIRPAEYGLYTEAQVKLSVNLNRLDEVWVQFP